MLSSRHEICWYVLLACTAGASSFCFTLFLPGQPSQFSSIRFHPEPASIETAHGHVQLSRDGSLAGLLVDLYVVAGIFSRHSTRRVVDRVGRTSITIDELAPIPSGFSLGV